MSDTTQPTLRQLLAPPVLIPVGTGSVEVRPMGWFVGCEAIEVLLPAIDAMPMTLDTQDEEPVLSKEVQEWVTFVVTHRAAVAAFCHKASGIDEVELRDLQPGLLIELLVGLLEINADFFVRSLPLLAQRVAGRAVAIQQSILAATAEATAAVLRTPVTGSTTSSVN